MNQNTEQIKESNPSDYEPRMSSLIERTRFKASLILPAREALNGYSSDLPYHNIEHMFTVAEDVLQTCEEYGLADSEIQLLVMAALWHDYDYKTPLEDHFESKEQRSAVYAYNNIMLHATEDNFAEQELFASEVASLVISTHKSHIPSNLYEAILNSADISNLSGPIALMLDRSIAFYIEGRLLDGEEVVGSTLEFLTSKRDALMEWCPMTQDVLSNLVQNKIGFGPLFSAVKDRISLITVDNLVNTLKTGSKSED